MYNRMIRRSLSHKYASFIIELGDAYEELSWFQLICCQSPSLDTWPEYSRMLRCLVGLISKGNGIRNLCAIAISNVANSANLVALCSIIDQQLTDICRELDVWCFEIVRLWNIAEQDRIELLQQLDILDQQ